MGSLASGNVTISLPIPALTSIGIALLTVGLKLLLVWASRASRKVGKGKRLAREDFLIWSDLVVIGALALFFLVVTREKAHVDSVPLIVGLSVVTLIGMCVLPSVINDFAYTKDGELGGKGVVWVANAFGLLILILCVALGAEVHG